MIYLLVFFLSSFLGHCAEKVSRLKYFCSFGAILLPSILGGIRDPRLGTDNYYFFRPDFIVAYHSNSFLEAERKLNFDLLSEYFFYIISRFTNDYHWLCFFTSLITMLLVYIAIFRNRKNGRVWLALLVFFFLFYCPLICYARQSIALALCFFSLYYAQKKKLLKFVLIITTAYFFHASAAILFLYYPIYHFLVKDFRKMKRRGIIIMGAVGVFVFIIVFVLPSLLSEVQLSVERLQILSNRYIIVERENTYLSTLKLSLSLSPPILVSVFFIRKLKDFIYYTNLLFVIISVLILQISYIDIHAYRLAYYYSFFLIFLLPQISKKIVGFPLITNIAILAYLVCYWYLFTVKNGYAFTLPVFPYSTDILNL